MSAQYFQTLFFNTHPPVLVPPIKSKTSHGLRTWLSLRSELSCVIISFNIKRLDSPLTPPPSRDRRHSPFVSSGLDAISVAIALRICWGALAKQIIRHDKMVNSHNNKEFNKYLRCRGPPLIISGNIPLGPTAMHGTRRLETGRRLALYQSLPTLA